MKSKRLEASVSPQTLAAVCLTQKARPVDSGNAAGETPTAAVGTTALSRKPIRIRGPFIRSRRRGETTFWWCGTTRWKRKSWDDGGMKRVVDGKWLVASCGSPSPCPLPKERVPAGAAMGGAERGCCDGHANLDKPVERGLVSREKASAFAKSFGATSKMRRRGWGCAIFAYYGGFSGLVQIRVIPTKSDLSASPRRRGYEDWRRVETVESIVVVCFMIFRVYLLLEMKLALILTFSPWEKEQQGTRWEYRWSWMGRLVRLSQGRSNRVKPSQTSGGMKLALILTFSPWEKEQQGTRWGYRWSWMGRLVRLSQGRSNRVKPSQTSGGMKLALILTFSPWEKEQQGTRWEYRWSWMGRLVRLSQGRSNRVKPSQTSGGMKLALILTFSPGRRNSKGRDGGSARWSWKGRLVRLSQGRSYRVTPSQTSGGMKLALILTFSLREKEQQGTRWEYWWSWMGRLVRLSQGRSNRVKPSQTSGGMKLALILTFSPWEKEQQGTRWEYWWSWMGRLVRLSQGRSNRVKPSQTSGGMKLALILTFSPWEKEQQGTRWECRWSWLGRLVRLSQGRSNRVKPSQTSGGMKLALILTFSPWEKEQQGTRWEYRWSWMGRLVRLSQGRSNRVKPSQTSGGMKLALILTFSPWEKEQQGTRWECRWSWLGRLVRLSQGRSNHRERKKEEGKRKKASRYQAAVKLSQGQSNHWGGLTFCLWKPYLLDGD